MMKKAGWLLVVAGVILSGCGYTATGSLHSAKYKTIAVPIFRNNTFYRNFEFQLTEELIKVIESRTPYKVVDRGRADTILLGEIVDVRKSTITKDVEDRVREFQLTITVNILWKDNRTGEILLERKGFRQASNAVVGLGETEETASREAFSDIAERIVELLEEPW